MDKKVWKRPEMTVLVRSKPEEAVLIACKAGTFTTSIDPNTSFSGCYFDVPVAGCQICTDIVSS